MFKKSTTNRQLDLFSSFDLNLDEARREVLNDPDEWHSLFFEHITNRINEAPYAVLYHETMGRPNAPIRLMVSMLILKEGFGVWRFVSACRVVSSAKSFVPSLLKTSETWIGFLKSFGL